MIRDTDQPLLAVHVRDQTNYLVPELCHEASLPKNFTKDSRKMKDLQDFKISNPDERFNRINSLIEKF